MSDTADVSLPSPEITFTSEQEFPSAVIMSREIVFMGALPGGPVEGNFEAVIVWRDQVVISLRARAPLDCDHCIGRKDALHRLTYKLVIRTPAGDLSFVSSDEGTVKMSLQEFAEVMVAKPEFVVRPREDRERNWTAALTKAIRS